MHSTACSCVVHVRCSTVLYMHVVWSTVLYRHFRCSAVRYIHVRFSTVCSTFVLTIRLPYPNHTSETPTRTPLMRAGPTLRPTPANAASSVPYMLIVLDVSGYSHYIFYSHILILIIKGQSIRRAAQFCCQVSQSKEPLSFAVSFVCSSLVDGTLF